MPHRPPTRHDIGKTVEVSDECQRWYEGRLTNIDCWQFSADDVSPVVLTTTFWIRSTGNLKAGPYSHCRVPYTSPDPIAEMHAAADLLVESGMNEAARVLMAQYDKRKQPPKRQPYFDPTATIDTNAIKPSNIGTHLYPGCSDTEHFYTSDCAYGCGCWMGGSRSGGPDGVDQFGTCPNNALGITTTP